MQLTYIMKGFKMEKRYFESFDKTLVPYLFFESARRESFKNNVVIFHGVTEHILRYEEFGKFLAMNGYNVFIPEIRGHGELKKDEICNFGEKGIFLYFFREMEGRYVRHFCRVDQTLL